MTPSVTLVCPQCRSALHVGPAGANCDGGHSFGRERGILDFCEAPGQDPDAAATSDHLCERSGMLKRLDNFVLPQIVAHIGHLDGVTVLDDGCGVGTVVEELCARGADGYGVDPGTRRTEWAHSAQAARLFIADGCRLPFADDSFDVVLSSGVLEHIGEPLPFTSREPAQRAYIDEALRVLRPGGVALLAAPNGAHPIDYWHSRHHHAAAAGSKGPFRVHWPYEAWMPNARDLRRWVAAAARPATIEFLSPEGYLAYDRVRQQFAGRVFTGAMRQLFRLMTVAPALATTFLNPWLVAKVVACETH